MAIRAMLTSGKEIEVPSYSLDYAIANKRITAFLRSDGWVNVGKDKIRKQQPGMLCLLGNGERDTDKLYIRSKA
jgi:hypothetical protein